MSVLTVAAERLKSQVGGVTNPEPPMASGPHPEPIHAFTTDLGSLEHLFAGAGFVQSASERVSTALVRATDSIRGPHGGLIPSSFQHVGSSGVTRVAAEDVMMARQQATSAIQILLARVRSLFSRG